MEGLKPTVFELLEVYLRRHSAELQATIVYGSIIMFPVPVVISILLLLRRQRKAESHPPILKAKGPLPEITYQAE